MRAWRALTFALLFMRTFSSLGAESQESVGDHLRQSREYLAQGNYQKSRDAARDALALDPNSAEAEGLIGSADLALDDFAAAEAHLRRALELQPGLLICRRTLAATYLKEKKLEDARQEFTAVLNVNHKDFLSRYSVGLTYLLAHHPTEALQHFAQALQLKPRDPTVLTGMLEAYLELNQRAKAEKALTEIDPQFSSDDPRRLQFAELLVSQGAYGLAALEFEALYRVHPDSYDIGYNLALAHHRDGKEDQASALLENLLARKDDAELEDLLGEVEEARGKPARSLAAFRRAMELEPTSEDYRFDYARALVDSSTLKDALEAFTRATREFPHSARMVLGLAATYYLAGKYQDAAETLLRAAEVAPNRPEVYYLLGQAYDAAGPLQNAIQQQFARYLDTGAVDPWAEYSYGRILARQAEQGAPVTLADAQRHLERAITLDDRLPESHAGLSDVLEMRGQYEEARAQLERAVQLNPKYSSAFYKLSQIYRRLGQLDKAGQAAATFERLKSEQNKNPDREQVQRLLERVRR